MGVPGSRWGCTTAVARPARSCRTRRPLLSPTSHHAPTTTEPNKIEAARFGAIHSLARMLQAREAPAAQEAAAAALGNLAANSAEAQSLIASAGAIPLLVGVLAGGTDAAKQHAARAIRNLGEGAARALHGCRSLWVLAAATPGGRCQPASLPACQTAYLPERALAPTPRTCPCLPAASRTRHPEQAGRCVGGRHPAAAGNAGGGRRRVGRQSAGRSQRAQVCPGGLSVAMMVGRYGRVLLE